MLQLGIHRRPRPHGHAPGTFGSRVDAVIAPTALVSTGLLAGAVAAVLLIDVVVEDPLTWIGYHRDITPVLTRALPPLGLLGLLATGVRAVRSRPGGRGPAAVATGLLLIGMLVTVVVHFPLNAEIATWDPATPPPNWREIRHSWQVAHAVRTVSTVAAFCALVVAVPGPARTP